jgi:hypothetical protein
MDKYCLLMVIKLFGAFMENGLKVFSKYGQIEVRLIYPAQLV